MKKSTLNAIMYGVIIVLVIAIVVTGVKLSTRPKIIVQEEESSSVVSKKEEITFFEENSEEVSLADVVARAKIIDDNINVRTGPGTDFDRLGSAYYGNTFEYISQSHDGWTKIKYDNKVAYVFSEYVELIPMVMNVEGEYTEYLGAGALGVDEMTVWEDENGASPEGEAGQEGTAPAAAD
ncbi:MAG: SH3 domain-containing protein [Lachnospiraceae bacterium]|nr:SH3 domain-containing protein [Lachnospiraceae bacterium]